MNKICNSRITKVEIEITESFDINVKLRFSFRTGKREMKFNNIKENADFLKIMEYAGVKKANMLKGKIIRCIIEKESNKIIGAGDPIEDKLLLFNNLGLEIPEKDLRK